MRPDRAIPFPGRRTLPALASAAAAVATAVLITLSVTGDDDLGTRVNEAAILPVARTTSLTETAELYDPGIPGGVLVLDLRDVPPAPARHHYEVWVLRAGAAMEMEAVGAFAPRDGRARLVLSLPGPGTYVSVEISIEENGGPPAHSGRRLASVRF